MNKIIGFVHVQFSRQEFFDLSKTIFVNKSNSSLEYVNIVLVFVLLLKGALYICTYIYHHLN